MQRLKLSPDEDPSKFLPEVVQILPKFAPQVGKSSVLCVSGISMVPPPILFHTKFAFNK